MTDAELLAAARQAAQFSYSPYSRFRVGAAILCEQGIVTGCNVENASFGLSICAERSALFAAVSAGARLLQAVAVACVDTPSGAPPQMCMPCGACRQVLAEFGQEDLPIIVDGVGRFTLADLLKYPFRLA